MLKKAILAIIVLIMLSCVSGYWYLNSKNPKRSGELKLAGLSSPVQVDFDNYGIPHIIAENDADLYRAFGYVHAQDRLFQMEMARRLSQGKLAEVLGSDLIGVDKLFRTLGIGEYGKRWIKAVEKRADPQLMLIMQRYLDGVNAFVENGATPVEFQLMGIPKHKFTLEDIASVAGYISFTFAHGLTDDPLVSYIGDKLGEDYLKDLGILYTPGFEQIPVDPRSSENLSVGVNSVINQLQPLGIFHGSNSWLLAPKRSESGKAILVNDPHIAFSQPSVWYEAQLSSDQTDIYGHFLGLVPLPMLGMNNDHAWGLTMFENDDMDLYVEKVNPENSEQYWAIDHWQAFETRAEIINVKGGQPIEMEVKITRHGPVVNHIFDGRPGANHGLEKISQPVSLWWAYLNTDNQMIEAFYQLPKADTLQKASKAASMIHAPGLNLMYANTKGDIAWWASAKLPIRPAHVNSKFVLDGASGKDDILGFYDFSHNPKKINPKSGILYSANNQPADMGDGLVTGYYSPTDRPTRILELLNKKEKFNPEDMKKMLMDNTTPSAHFFQQVVLPILQSKQAELSPIEIDAMHAFASWKGNHSSNEIGATIYNRFRLTLMRLIMQDEIGKPLFDGFQFGFLMDRSIWRILDKPSSRWWDNVNTNNIETREQIIVEAWHQSNAFLKNRFGDDLSKWTWRADIKMVHHHPLGKVAALAGFFNVGPLPSEAGVEAINNLSFKAVGDDLQIMMGPSTRRVIDFADVENSWGINPTGESGVFTDHHYDDQAVDYSQGKFRHHWISQDKIEQNLEGRLIFRP